MKVWGQIGPTPNPHQYDLSDTANSSARSVSFDLPVVGASTVIAQVQKCSCNDHSNGRACEPSNCRNQADSCSKSEPRAVENYILVKLVEEDVGPTGVKSAP